ncbi:MAG: helix-turn-helix domain-containing protein [Sarcina sp.]|nr:helix-turn-helix domain-containing protein [Sarcina sp.]HAL59615.1 DNA-binding protein [Sarcina sp.]
MPVTNRDFYTYIQDNIIDTSTAASLLRCSRQNILDLVKRGKLKPVLTLKNNYLFLREEIFR